MMKIHAGLILCLLPAGVLAQEFALGVDLSYVNEMEDCDARYFDREGVQGDPYDLLSGKGANMVRLRLWHTPSWTMYSNFEDVKRAMVRAKQANMEVMLDFHYSDFWADPSRQWRPAAWNGISDPDILGDSLYNYTYATLDKLFGEGLVPAIVQVGNEINGNMLIERDGEDIDGDSPGMFPLNWPRQVGLIHRGIAAVQQFNTDRGTDVGTLVHVAQPENATWWFAQATEAGLKDYDIIGLSYYPQWSDFGIRELGDHVAYLRSEYGKEVMIVETGYPWTFDNNDGAGNVLGWGSRLELYGNEVSQEVQRDFLTELSWLVKENGGTGLFYWEPAWVSTSCSTYWSEGSHYDNATLFDFDGRLHWGADYLEWDYSQVPPGLQDRKVHFRVNMTGVDRDQGVWITGDFTGDPWQFVAMQEEQDGWYSLDTLIPGRSTGAYIFYNNNAWDDQFREEVPPSCAEVWDTHRKYLVATEDESYAFAWGTCTLNPTGMHSPETGPPARYLAAREMILLGQDTVATEIRITDLSGRFLPVLWGGERSIRVDHLGPGLYILLVDGPRGTNSYKFIRS